MICCITLICVLAVSVRRSEIESLQKEVELLLVQVADLDREKRAAVEVERQRADEAEVKAAKVESERKKEEVMRKGEQLTNLAMRLKFLPLEEVMMLVIVEHTVLQTAKRLYVC